MTALPIVKVEQKKNIVKDTIQKFLLQALHKELEKKHSCSFEPIYQAVEKKKKELEKKLVHRFSKMYVTKAPDYLMKDEPDNRTKILENLLKLLGGSRYSSTS
jgi:hypothetical protein